MRKFLTLSFIWLFVPVLVSGQSFNEQLYPLYLSGKMDTWEVVMNQQSRQLVSYQDHYDLALAYYGFIGYCLGTDQKDRARAYIDKGEHLAEFLIEKAPSNAAYLALRGAYYGFRIGFQPQKAPFIGPKALKMIHRAVEADPDSPYALIESGNKDWWMPEIFGGSKERAIQAYEKAIRVFDTNPELRDKNWYYLNAQMILADWYVEEGMPAKSIYLYRKILTFAPDFEWAGEKVN